MKTTTFIFAVFSALAVQADYLYWMVNTDSASEFASQYTAVRLTDGSNVYDSYTDVSNSDIANYQASGYYFTAENLTPAFNDATSYFVELYNSSGTVAQSSAITGAALRSAMAYYSGSGMSVGAATPASFGGFTSTVPEPTSGLLFLVGGALLGLRRRRRV